MLYRNISTNVNIPTVSGHELEQDFFTKSQRAAIAAQLVMGELDLTDLQLSQIARLVGVSRPYVYKAVALSPADRDDMRCGELRMADVPTIPSKRKVEQTVMAAGVARVWDAIVPLI
jgi:hypothetical protein